MEHKIIPDGHSKHDFENQDFCFYDAIEITRTPEVVREMQSKLRDGIEQRIMSFDKRDDSPNAIKEAKQSPPKRKVSAKKKLQILIEPTRPEGTETVDVRIETAMGLGYNSPNSPTGSILTVDLHKPTMRKTSKPKLVISKKHHGKKKKSSMTQALINLNTNQNPHSSDDSQSIS